MIIKQRDEKLGCGINEAKLEEIVREASKKQNSA